MIVLGSAGRGESLLAMDQDNAVIFERGRAGRRKGSLVRHARNPCRGYPASGRRALLQGRRDGQQRALARLGRNLEEPRRALDHAFQA